MPDHVDEPLVAAAMAGDDDALRSLIADHYQMIWRVCRRIVGNDQDADDATQETLIKVIRNITAFDRRSKFSTWTYRIASNCSLDVLRKRKRHLRSVSLEHTGGSQRTRELEDAEANEAIEQIADRAAFDAALQQLDDDFRIPLVLRDVGTLSYAEISEQLGIPVGTVKSRIARARQSLLSILESSADEVDQVRRDELGNRTEAVDVKPFDPPDPL